ncbi:MAG: DUF4091 domain-containing protein, partial [Armatimonadota bacterium]|nr:DUF4091 domain-containing protein [Armatimonadota bacterium]
SVSRAEVEGKPVLVVRGAGQDSAFWRSPDLLLQAGKTYVLRFRARTEGTGGTIISGLNNVNRDFGTADRWREFAFAFRVPEAPAHFVRLGQWHLKGTALFQNAEMYPVQVVHRRWGNLVLGEGETIHQGEYTDIHSMGWFGSNIHRTLLRQQCYFNTNRWVLGTGDEVVYRHQIPFTMQQARLHVNVNYHTGGSLVVSVSRDGREWRQVASASKVQNLEVVLPADLFPTRQVYVRLSTAGEGAHAQVDYYHFRAKIDYQGTSRTGRTLLIEERFNTPSLQAEWSWQGDAPRVRWTNRQPSSRQVEVAMGTGRGWQRVSRFSLKPNGSAETALRLPGLSAGQHTVGLRVTSGRAMLYAAQTEVQVMVLDESHYGYRLAAPAGFGEVWWCEGAWKVGRDRPAPTGDLSPAIHIEAARGEWEPAQLVLRARQPNTVIEKVEVSDLVGKQTRINASQVRLYEVATVQVQVPSDSLGAPGEYPDPLPPLKTPFSLPQERNQAIWILVHVPNTAPAGDYQGNITVHTNRGRVVAPLKVTVFDFSLPKFATLRSGFGISHWNIKRYHHLQTPEQEKQVWEMYMRSFAEHRISPYSFYAYAPIHVRFEGEGAEKKVVVDFSEFDKAASYYLDEVGFNAFVLPLQGMGGGTFHERWEGEFGGFRAGTPEYERLWGDYVRQVEAHLREKGWLEKAYVYWFDEPEPRDYDFVIEGMRRLKRHAPGIRRMLTEQPEPPLYGHVDLWCGLTPHWTREMAEERKKAGEEVWWYICTGPRAPYIGLFIEHPAVELRLWGWQSWQYGIQGILIWETVWWTSPTAFPNSLQNPWEDPMSYVSGYGVPEGTKQFWGNGDGRFLYPPRRDPNGQHPPAVEPPSPSIRWENLRDGVEDYEYFVILQRLVERTRGKAPAALLAEAEKLLQVPAHISQDLTNFTKDPRPLLEHRRKIARMIERLQKVEGGRSTVAQEGGAWR